MQVKGMRFLRWQVWGKKEYRFTGNHKKEEMMRRKKMFPAIFLLALFLLSCATTQQISTKVVPDTARVVRLYVPACTWEATEARIRAILGKIDGVYEVKGDASSHYVYVTFDPDKTSVEVIMKALDFEEFFPRGEPVFIKWPSNTLVTNVLVFWSRCLGCNKAWTKLELKKGEIFSLFYCTGVFPAVSRLIRNWFFEF